MPYTSPFPSSTQPVPARVYYENGQITADWVDLAGTDPTLPFLSDRIATAFHLGRAPLPSPSQPLPPATVIFHTGRCGSTLVSRSLSLLQPCHVLSEPPALNTILSVDGPWPFLPRTIRLDALQRVVSALFHSAAPGQDRIILKLSSWNTLRLWDLEEIFPDGRLLYIYRSPAEILVSLQESPSGWMQRWHQQARASLFLGLPTAQIARTPLGFAAQVVGYGMTMVAKSATRTPSRWQMLPYPSLPAAITDNLIPALGIPLTPADQTALRRQAASPSKHQTPSLRFSTDQARKQAAVTEEIRDLATAWTEAPYAAIEQCHTSHLWQQE